MSELRTELAELELEGLDLDTLEIQETGHVVNRGELESLTLGHGMIEVGASVALDVPEPIQAELSACCSCCYVCCCAG